MNIIECIDSEIVGGLKSNKSLNATTNDEIELINSIAKLLFETKSVRKTIQFVEQGIEISKFIKKSQLKDKNYKKFFSKINVIEECDYNEKDLKRNFNKVKKQHNDNVIKQQNEQNNSKK